MTEIELIRHNNLVDPNLHIWGWEIPVYLFLGGVTAGIMILTGLLKIPLAERSRWARWLPFSGAVLISLGMLALFLDLAYKLHVFRFYTAFRLTSPMSWGAWILLGIYPATLGLGLAGLSGAELDKLARFWPLRVIRLERLLRWIHRVSTEREKGLRWANVILGVGLGAYTGILLGTLGARAAWSSSMLGPLFLVSGLSTGAALMMLFPLGHDEHAFLRRWDMTAIAAEVLLIGLYFLGLLTVGGQAGREAFALFFGGRYTALFWSLVIIAGLAVPFLIEAVEARKKLRPTLFAPILLLVGGLSLRFILVAAGQV